MLIALREQLSENHAVLKYGSTSTLSDFAQILSRVTLQGGNEVRRILARNASKRYRGQRVSDRF